MPEHLSKKLINWASIIGDNTRDQAITSATMPFIYPHVALMPDAHLGKGATVGSVIPTLGAIIPAAVGVDIGCGMIAVRTQWTETEFRGLFPGPSTGPGTGPSMTQLRESIESAIPLSAGQYNSEIIAESTAARILALEEAAVAARFSPETYAANWRLQLGTLGSGNHFIEVTVDEASRVWLFLHSGSRGIGNKIAQHHIKVAQQQMTKWWISVPDPDLAYLVEGTDEFWKYIRELRWAQEFARENREEMMDRVCAQIEHLTGVAVCRKETINCHHNFTEQEQHFGKKVWVSRKGAIKAAKGDRGLIPGSMGTASYVVVGKGNPLSLNSSPHGAGRSRSRNETKKMFTAADLEVAMAGIEYRHTDAFIDEIPQAYKDIDVVMADAADLVTIEHTLHQILNVKGD
ncbi:RtcB family protein [Nakamurella antarctica]|uniref:3'-phosphate/5'-hydroxy nucleic acid ligase n=1 Tax=Nakamurella antarctica TaxID=1902245 RepID=A0A3G8ZTE5_9ACTN|nr:RtcB family protein [Nakamurella antarctica]AZI57316.1 RtcB family protein [Nakamurella antarctica]